MSYRDIDIDALEEQYMTPAELVPDLPAVSAAEVSQAESQAKAAVNSGQLLPALEAVLANPPYVADAASTKDDATRAVFDVLVAIRNHVSPAEVGKLVGQLNQEYQDTLIKYLYKIMATPYGAKQGASILSWFEKTIEITGVGSIVRGMSDRRTV